ncbi:MAG: response regulator, partial [Bacteroidota bacterium]
MRKPRIYIVEDEFIISADIEKQLKNLGYEVVGMAVTVNEAQSDIAELQPDLVLLDIHLSDGVPGTQLGKVLREEGRIPF